MTLNSFLVRLKVFNYLLHWTCLSRRRAPLPWNRQTRPRPSWTPPSGRSSSKTSTNSTSEQTTTPPSRTAPRRSSETSPTTSRPASSASTSRPTPARTRWSPGSSGSCGWRRRVTRGRWIRRWRAAWSSVLTALRGSSSPSRAPARSMSPSIGYTTPSHGGGLSRYRNLRFYVLDCYRTFSRFLSGGLSRYRYKSFKFWTVTYSRFRVPFFGVRYFFAGTRAGVCLNTLLVLTF